MESPSPSKLVQRNNWVIESPSILSPSPNRNVAKTSSNFSLQVKSVQKNGTSFPRLNLFGIGGKQTYEEENIVDMSDDKHASPGHTPNLFHCSNGESPEYLGGEELLEEEDTNESLFSPSKLHKCFITDTDQSKELNSFIGRHTEVLEKQSQASDAIQMRGILNF